MWRGVPLLLTLLALVAQTAEAPDFSGVTALVTSLLFAILPLIIVVALVGWILKLFNKLPSIISAVPLASAALLVGQTNSVDFSAITALILNLMLAILPLIIIVMVLQMFFRIFDSFGRIFSVRLAPAAAAALVAQTTIPYQSGIDAAQGIASILSGIMMPLVTVLLLVLLPILIFKSITRGILDKI